MNCDLLLMLGTDFPYRQFYPTEAKIAQVDLRPANLGRRCRLDLGLVGDVSDTIEALLPRLKPKSRPSSPRALSFELPPGARRARRTRRRTSRAQADPSAISREQDQRARGRRRRFHLRRRHADHLGGAIPENEREAPAAWIARARVDGQRHAAGHRRAGGVSGSTGRLHVGRRRLRHADGRLPHPPAARSCRSSWSSSTTARSASSNWR